MVKQIIPYFTLFNGGGKGVMMQLIFQLLHLKLSGEKAMGIRLLVCFMTKRKTFFTFHVVFRMGIRHGARKKTY